MIPCEMNAVGKGPGPPRLSLLMCSASAFGQQNVRSGDVFDSVAIDDLRGVSLYTILLGRMNGCFALWSATDPFGTLQYLDL